MCFIKNYFLRKIVRLNFLIVITGCVFFFFSINSSGAQNPNFTGVWLLDQSASDSMEKLLKILRKSKFEQKMADLLVVEQHIVQNESEIIINIDNQIATYDQTIKINGEMEYIDTPHMGNIKTCTYWSDNGLELITDMYVAIKSELDVLCRSKRMLIDKGSTMVLNIEIFPINDPSTNVKRIFRKKLP